MQIISQYAYLVISLNLFDIIFLLFIFKALLYWCKCEELKTARRFFVLCASDMRCT